MKQHSSEFPVVKMAEVLKVSRSGYYDWLKGREGKRKKENRELKVEIARIHRENKEVYGSPRITGVLRNEGRTVSITRVARLMKEEGLRAKTKKAYKATTDSKHNKKISPNLLERDFTVYRPNQVWVSDITYIATKEGWLYLCVIIDLFSRMVVGWTVDRTLNRSLVINALKRAYFRRRPGPGLLFHSDRGSQYCSDDFRKVLKQYKMIQSMSRKGDCWDNAPSESFFGTLKNEAIYYRPMYETRAEGKNCLFEHIELFYNGRRLHSTLGQVSPLTFEKRWREQYERSAA